MDGTRFLPVEDMTIWEIAPEQLLAGVDEMGLDSDTLWFFTSDNGSPLGNDNHGNGPLFDGKFTTCAQQRPCRALTSLPPC